MKSTMAKGMLASSSAVNVPISLAILAKSLGYVASRLTPPRRRLCLDGPKQAALAVRPPVLTYRHSTNFRWPNGDPAAPSLELVDTVHIAYAHSAR
jgi:hypothetical protein